MLVANRRGRGGALSRVVGRYWGYPILVFVLYAGITGLVGPGIVASGSALSLLYLLFVVPTWCGAPNRDGTSCRNNARGLLLGCNRVRRHKVENLKLIFRGQKWTGLLSRFFGSVRNGAASISALASATSASAAVITLVIKL